MFGISFARKLVCVAENCILPTLIFTTVQRSRAVCTKSKPKVKRTDILIKRWGCISEQTCYLSNFTESTSRNCMQASPPKSI
jgi:hypothetical protein